MNYIVGTICILMAILLYFTCIIAMLFFVGIVEVLHMILRRRKKVQKVVDFF